MRTAEDVPRSSFRPVHSRFWVWVASRVRPRVRARDLGLRPGPLGPPPSDGLLLRRALPFPSPGPLFGQRLTPTPSGWVRGGGGPGFKTRDPPSLNSRLSSSFSSPTPVLYVFTTFPSLPLLSGLYFFLQPSGPFPRRDLHPALRLLEARRSRGVC